jgi:hypothetical protein
MIAVMCAYGWMKLFFGRRMVFTSFFLTLFGVCGSAAVFLGYSIFFSAIVSSILAGIWVGFTLYATLLTAVAAFSVPNFKEKDDDSSSSSLLAAAMDPQQQMLAEFEAKRAALAHQQFLFDQQQQQQKHFMIAAATASPLGAACPAFVSAAALNSTRLAVPQAHSNGLVNRGGGGGK